MVRKLLESLESERPFERMPVSVRACSSSATCRVDSPIHERSDSIVAQRHDLPRQECGVSARDEDQNAKVDGVDADQAELRGHAGGSGCGAPLTDAPRSEHKQHEPHEAERCSAGRVVTSGASPRLRHCACAPPTTGRLVAQNESCLDLQSGHPARIVNRQSAPRAPATSPRRCSRHSP